MRHLWVVGGERREERRQALLALRLLPRLLGGPALLLVLARAHVEEVRAEEAQQREQLARRVLNRSAGEQQPARALHLGEILVARRLGILHLRADGRREKAWEGERRRGE